MKQLRLRAPHHFERGFARIRRELDVPQAFPDEVLDAAFAAEPADVDRVDARHLPFVAIDPPGATDLDQAFFAERHGDGYRVHYAIADVGAWVPPGGPVDLEARARGTTLYSPDLRTPLHPTILSEDRASLLAGHDRTALLWTIDLDASGQRVGHRLERATVRNREAISYAEAQARLDAADRGEHDGLGAEAAAVVEALGLLREIGRHRRRIETERGGVSLNLPAQEVVEAGGTYRLAYDRSIPIEDWNAQISLLTGMCAGDDQLSAGVGILRTLPPPQTQDLGRLRRQAEALGIAWPEQVTYPELVRSIHPDTAANSAFLLACARSLRGAGYQAFTDGERPEHPEHGAIAAVYAHVTAPLRRLVDRFANEILLALHAEETPPAWAVEALDELPSLMGRARSRERALERAQLDFAEALVLESAVGRDFTAHVLDHDERRDRYGIQLVDPAIVADLRTDDAVDVGAEIVVRLTEVDPDRSTVHFEVSRP